MELVRNHAWVGSLVWALLYVSDYYLTLFGARLYRAGVERHYALTGSYELTPAYQPDIDAQRRVSLLFVAWLLGLSLVLIGLHWAAREMSFFALYEAMLGAVVLVEVPVHIRHVRNIAFFREVLAGGVTGRLELPRALTLRSSAVELAAFGVLFLAVAIVAWSPFALGGAAKTLQTAVQHHRMAGRAARAASQA